LNRAQRRAARRSGRVVAGAAQPDGGPAAKIRRLVDEGLAHHRNGDVRRAADCYRQALAAEPANADVLTLFGALSHQQGDLAEAERMLRRALKIRPRSPQALCNLGVVMQTRGDVQDAAECFRRAISARPDFAEAHANLGLASRHSGDSVSAEASFREALRLAPDLTSARDGLLEIYRSQGRHDQALAALGPAVDGACRAFRRTDGALEQRRLLADTLIAAGMIPRDPDRRAVAARLLIEPGIDPQTLAPAVMASLRADPAIAELIETPDHAGDDFDRATRDDGALADPVFVAALRSLILPDAGIERLLTALRHWLLEIVIDEGAGADPPEALVTIAAALAEYCFFTEYVFPAGETERARAAGLHARLDGDEAVAPFVAAVSACYRPLPGTRTVRAPSGDARLARLVRQQIEEPGTEDRLATGIPALSKIDPASETVRAQYEENPYPRWQRVADSDSGSFAEVVASRLPWLDPASLPRPSAPRILVAGCGTGRQAIICAKTFPQADILAVDLSRASLAYAKRKAAEYGIGNISFRQADILRLPGLQRRFDLIECTGVLHHLRDPAAGWRILRDLLAPDGLMRVALYSARARRHVLAARSHIAKAGFAPTADGIRECRQDILALPREHPAAWVTQIKDFYALSPCRDLLFHVQETCFSILEIAGLIADLDLEFLGFDLAAEPVQAAARQPGAAIASLDWWADVEARLPDTFAGMYDFWVRRG